MQALLIGGIMSLIFGGIMVELFLLHPVRPIPEKDVFWQEGTLTHLEEHIRGRGYATLCLGIEGIPHRFHCFNGPYPQHFDRAKLQELLIGSTVSLAVHRQESASRHPPGSDHSFVPVVAIKAGAADLLSLNSYNTWSESNQAVARWFLPTMFVLCLYLTWRGWEAKKAGRSYA